MLVLDICARTADGRIVQIEMQRANHTALRPRMLYGWARVYSGQLSKAEPYSKLEPVVSIWICDEDVFPEASGPHLTFELREREEHLTLHEHCRIDVLRLAAWREHPEALNAEPARHWFWFFNDAMNWRRVPESIRIPVLEDAMATLHDFRRDVQLGELYRGRLEALRLENERLEALEQALLDTKRAREELAELEAERQQAEQQRQQAEQQRQQAEQQRQQAEQERAHEAAERRRAEARIKELEEQLTQLQRAPDGSNGG